MVAGVYGYGVRYDVADDDDDERSWSSSVYSGVLRGDGCCGVKLVVAGVGVTNDDVCGWWNPG